MSDQPRSPIAAQEAAVEVIAGFLIALLSCGSDRALRASRTLVARLAGHNPPILLCFPDEIKETP